MSIKTWRGGADVIQEQGTITIGGTIEAGDKFRVTRNGKTVEFIATNTSATTTAAGLYAALAASTLSEISSITWSNPSNGVVGWVGPDDGADTSFTVSTVESNEAAADGQTITRLVTVDAEGPTHVDLAENYVGGVAPVNGDDLIITGPYSMFYGMDLSAVTLASLTVKNFSGRIGLPRDNPTGYVEFLTRKLRINSPVVSLNEGVVQAIAIGLDLGASSADIVVHEGFDLDSNGEPNILLLDTGGSGSLTVQGNASVGVSFHRGDAASDIPEVYVSGSQAKVYIGEDAVAFALAKVTDGLLEINQDLAELQLLNNGVCNQRAGLITLVSGDSGQLNVLTGGAATTVITTLNVGDLFTANFNNDPRPKIVTNTNGYGAGTIIDEFGTVTWTTDIQLIGTSLQRFKLRVGNNVQVGISAI